MENVNESQVVSVAWEKNLQLMERNLLAEHIKIIVSDKFKLKT